MNQLQHLLIKAAEECNELAVELQKTAQFGLDSSCPKTKKTNLERIQLEYNDLSAVIIKLGTEIEKHGKDTPFKVDGKLIQAKFDKLKKFGQISRDLGMLS